MLVYICCSGGATSSLFCSKIGQASDEKVLVEHIFIVLQDLEHLMESYDMILAYGPAELLNDRQEVSFRQNYYKCLDCSTSEIS